MIKNTIIINDPLHQLITKYRNVAGNRIQFLWLVAIFLLSLSGCVGLDSVNRIGNLLSHSDQGSSHVSSKYVLPSDQGTSEANGGYSFCNEVWVNFNNSFITLPNFLSYIGFHCGEWLNASYGASGFLIGPWVGSWTGAWTGAGFKYCINLLSCRQPSVNRYDQVSYQPMEEHALVSFLSFTVLCRCAGSCICGLLGDGLGAAVGSVADVFVQRINARFFPSWFGSQLLI